MDLLSFNKRGNTVFFLLMIGILFFILGLALTPALSQTISESTSTAQLNCSNSSISDQDKAVCTSIDAQNFLFMGTIFGLAGILLAGAVIR